MKIIIEPTLEVTQLSLNGAILPFRVWVGYTDKGTKIDAYVLSIVPDSENEEDLKFFREQIPPFMNHSRDVMSIGT